eukprot:TRINITY_DN11162_c0_g1_i1.p1 TRINITY_DN11162_c0_g1~~TRINITY_DN11162_c0_g1_i1.p1  ORF type:complete len:436 (-),score=95.99 TRINITY_DN11162_c0_g1_i1:42-1214(-)
MERRETVLDEEKNGILARFQEVTQEPDISRSIQVLESHQWDLSNAIQEYSGGNVNNNGWGTSIYNLGASILGMFMPSGLSNSDSTTDARVACRRFIDRFEVEHGTVHPNFVIGSYNEALAKAKAEFKFLLVYLHSNMHESTPSFCQETLCSDIFTDFVNEEMVSWAGSIQMSEAYRVSLMLNASSFPFIAVICNNLAGGVTLLDRIEGEQNTQLSRLLPRLRQLLEANSAVLVAARAEENERNADRLIREEQDQAYLESLAKDQERDRIAQQQRLEQEAIQRESQRQTELKQKRIREMAERIPIEPKEGPRIQIRMSDGSRLQRMFAPSDPLRALFDYVGVKRAELGESEQDFDLVSNFPRQIFSSDRYHLTLEQAGLCPQASLFVQERF